MTVQTGSGRVRPYSPADEAAVLGILTSTLPRWSSSADAAALWRWKHADNPFGPSGLLVHETTGGDVVGCVALMCWHLRHGQQIVRAARTTDLATLVTHRRQGVASSFHLPGRQMLVDDGVQLVFHTPNEQSLPFTRRTTRPVFTVRSRVALTRLSRLGAAAAGLSRTPSATSRRPVSSVRRAALDLAPLLASGELEDLIERDAERRAPRLHTARSVPYLRWRYAAHPTIPSYACVVSRGSRPDGMAIFRVDEVGTARRLVVMDVLLRSTNVSIRRALRDELRAAADTEFMQQLDADPGSSMVLPSPSCPTWKAWALTVGLYAGIEGVSPLALDAWSLSLGDLQEI